MERIVHLDAIAIPAKFPLPRPSFAHEWVSYENTPYELIAERCQDATIVVTNKCRLTAENMAQMPQLKLIAELATGYNNIDLMGACAYPTRKSGDKQAKSVRCTYNANFTRQGIEGALSLLTRSSERGSACG